MKKFILLIFTTTLCAQNLPNEFVGFGASYNQQLSPPVSGWGVYAKKITDKTYSFNVVDITSKTLKPFTVQTVTSTGIAQYIGSYSKMKVFGIINAGVAAAESNVGFGYSGGVAFTTKIKDNIILIIPVRVQKTTLGDWQGTIGVGIGLKQD
jgi:hypothetical protein